MAPCDWVAFQQRHVVSLRLFFCAVSLFDIAAKYAFLTNALSEIDACASVYVDHAAGARVRTSFSNSMCSYDYCTPAEASPGAALQAAQRKLSCAGVLLMNLTDICAAHDNNTLSCSSASAPTAYDNVATAASACPSFAQCPGAASSAGLASGSCQCLQSRANAPPPYNLNVNVQNEFSAALASIGACLDAGLFVLRCGTCGGPVTVASSLDGLEWMPTRSSCGAVLGRRSGIIGYLGSAVNVTWMTSFAYTLMVSIAVKEAAKACAVLSAFFTLACFTPERMRFYANSPLMPVLLLRQPYRERTVARLRLAAAEKSGWAIGLDLVLQGLPGLVLPVTVIVVARTATALTLVAIAGSVCLIAVNSARALWFCGLDAKRQQELLAMESTVTLPPSAAAQ
jgi:hypothetical protein